MKKIRKAVFPAAGMGTRFLPATKAQPKEMLPIVDKPSIQYTIEEAVNSNIKLIILITGRGKRAIEDHFDRSYELENFLIDKRKISELKELISISTLASIAYIRQKEPLGLGHAVLVSEPLIDSEPFAVVLGDDIIISKKPVLKQMKEIFERINRPIIAVQRVPKEDVSSYGIVKVRKYGDRLYQIEDLVEKPSVSQAPSNLAIIGRYILVPEIFDCIRQTKKDKKGEIQLTDALKLLLNKTEIFAYEFEGKRYDIGNKMGFLKATVELALKREDLKEEFLAYLKSLKLDEL